MIKIDAVPGEFYTIPPYYRLTELDVAAIKDFVQRVSKYHLFGGGANWALVEAAYQHLPDDFKNAKKA